MDENLLLSPSGCVGNTVSGKSILLHNEIPDRKAVIHHNSPAFARAQARGVEHPSQAPSNTYTS